MMNIIRTSAAFPQSRCILNHVRSSTHVTRDCTGRWFSSTTSIGSEQLPHQQPTILDPLVVCGPSGVGKGTVIKRFLEVQEEQYYTMIQANERVPQEERSIFIEFVFAVSHTTREPRPNERNGVHYHFVTMEEMNKLIIISNTKETSTSTSSSTPSMSSYFVEHAKVHGNMYGTSWDSINTVHTSTTTSTTMVTADADTTTDSTVSNLNNTKLVRKALLDIDIQGVQRLKMIELEQQEFINKGHTLPFLLKPKYIFIAPPNPQSLQERLEARGTESKLSMRTRTNNAMIEMNYGCDMLRYAYDTTLDVMYRKSKNFDTVIINGVSVNNTVDDFMIAIDRIYNIQEFERPNVKATKEYDEDIILAHEEMMYK
jgi:guanylate kinase